MSKGRIATGIVLAGSLSLVSSGVHAQMGDQADVVENFATEATGGPDLLLAENAHIERSPDGITISVRMPTPEPGSYTYPETVPPERQAHPEGFTGWAFVFNHPELCVTNPEPPRCGPQDFNDQVRFGAYNFGGHVSSLSQHGMGELIANEATDGMLTISGSVLVGQAEREMPDRMTFPLENPEGAEVHAAIAPHGQLDVSLLPKDMYEPTGSPDCGCWWVAIFLPPA